MSLIKKMINKLHTISIFKSNENFCELVYMVNNPDKTYRINALDFVQQKQEMGNPVKPYSIHKTSATQEIQ